MSGRENPMDLWLSRKLGGEPLAEYRLRKLAETVAYAKEKSRFYQEHLRGRSAPLDMVSFQKLPFVTAEDLVRDGPRMLCVPQHEIERIVTLTTSGTTGEPKRVYFTREDQELTVDFFHNGMQCLVGKDDRVMILLPWRTPGSVGDLLHQGLLRLGCRSHPYGLIEDFSAAGTYILENGITSLVGNPVQVGKLAEISRRAGHPIRLRSVLLSTDYVPDALSARLTELWGCRVFEHYGMTEMCFGGGVYCDALAGYHLREADLYFEIISPDGETLPPGEYGEIVFTTLTRTGMPLIRYRTGDFGRILAESCPCGSPYPLMEKVRRRMEGGISGANGENLPIGRLDEALFVVPGLTDYRLTEEDGCLMLQVRLAGKDAEGVRQCIVDEIERLTGRTPVLTIEEEDGGPQGPLIKRKFVKERNGENS